MCLIIAFVFAGLAVTEFGRGGYALGGLYSLIAIAFLALMIRNIDKTRKERRGK